MAKAANSSNTYDQAVLQTTVREIDQAMSDLLSERGSYMARCKGIRQRIKDAYANAKEDGIPVRELRLLMRNREREARIEASIQDLEADARATYELLFDTLGDFGETPLGTAALEKVKPKQAALDSLTQQ